MRALSSAFPSPGLLLTIILNESQREGSLAVSKESSVAPWAAVEKGDVVWLSHSLLKINL